MFKRKAKRDEQIIKLIEEELRFEMDEANKKLDLYKDSESETFLQEYYIHKGRFTMCNDLLSQIQEM